MPLTREEIEAKRAAAMAKGGQVTAPAAALAGRAAAGAPAMPNQSRLTLARAAIRPEMKGRVMLSGPAGAGKTYTGLVIATVLVGPEGRILVIDSEKESSLTYADLFTFDHLRWNPPFDPTALSLTLKEAAADYDCIIVDSFSHFWRKQGGVLDIAGDNVRGWKAARPIQENLIETILDVDCHVIVCCRSKMEHLIEDKGGGRITVTKAGIKAQQDDDLEYEVNVALELDMPHVLHIVKSRTNAVPVGSQFLAGLAGDFAQQYRDWLRSGEAVADQADTNALRVALDKVADPGDRTRAKMQFLDVFGRPEFLLVSRLAEAQQWVADVVAGTLPIERGPDEEPPDTPPDSTPGGSDAPSAASPPAQPAAAPAPTQDASVKEGAGAPSAPAAEGDTGYCDRCGGAIWYSAENGGAWLHADEADDELCRPVTITPAAVGVNVDELYVKAHPPSAEEEARLAKITAEVEKLTQTKLLKAIKDAKLSVNGQPTSLRQRLVEYRMSQPAA